MGPWSHGGWAAATATSSATSPSTRRRDFYREQIELPFFEHHLKGTEPNAARGVGVRDRHERSGGSSTPGRRRRRPNVALLPRDGDLFAAAGGARGEDGDDDEYVSDPAKPVPFIEQDRHRHGAEYMTADQRFARAGRTCSSTRRRPLEEDLTVAGPIEVELYVSTTGTDADWVVKLIDVYPDDCPDRGRTRRA